MSDKTEKKAGKAEKSGPQMIDPTATSPSKDPKRKDKTTATATEPNSRERVARKTSRTGRNNGGDEARRGGLNMDLTPDTLGEREGVSPAETDLIWTNDSKDRWGADQPDHAALLAQRNEIEKQRREREER